MPVNAPNTYRRNLLERISACRRTPSPGRWIRAIVTEGSRCLGSFAPYDLHGLSDIPAERA